ncbi:MAG TPA: alanine--tRNA ligase [Tepidisphaeraceae bacterium]|nr:alanine--tRNA ligase [Tepidisphaeraceae bacterium]
MTSKQIRQQFIDFFVQKHGHTFVPSSPVVPHDDPTLLFTNAGMNQFKPIFLGQEKRAYTRAVNTQKCIRAGGKHNDLDDVGRSRRHHTFFEMLGNWSFGDYFKQGAIEMSWELLTKVWKLDPTRLHVSCFEGDEKNGVPRDTEAADIWRKVANWEQYGHKSDDHIHYFGKDNFWEMGDTGPCGPCTEIYIDRTPDKTGGPQVNGEDPRVMEIWNNVFIQYNRNADRSLTTLPSQHVDTGMGFERITQVIQNVSSNYEIDLFHPFWTHLQKLSGHTYTAKYPKTNNADPIAEAADPSLRNDIAFRVIADHVRCLTFALTDGATPSNEGRGYVLRRILRRAVRFGRQQLNLKDPFLHTLVPIVIEAMGDAFPELKKNPQHVIDLVKDEEISFGRTLDRGLSLFEEVTASEITNLEFKPEFSARGAKVVILPPQGGGVRIGIVDRDKEFIAVGIEIAKITSAWRDQFFTQQLQLPSSTAFKLHDTYGFPIDLTRIMAEERGMTVDLPGYEKLMEEAREKARLGGKTEDTSLTTLPPDAIAKLQSEKIPPTNDQYKYDPKPLTASIQAIWNGEKFVNETNGRAALIFNHTNFYPEMGGQVGDTGTLTKAHGSAVGSPDFSVESTKSAGPYILHIGTGSAKINDQVTLTLSPARNLTQKNHTTTHLANWALREVLGEGVQQKGSLVDPEKLRFDFSHPKSLELAELEKVETLVNQAIAKNLPVYAENAPQDQALKISGLRAVFGEKYPPQVRVVSIGIPIPDLLANPDDPQWRNYSIEFCGGTHLTTSSEAQSFAITAEESVSKGIRRLTALTGPAAQQSQQLSTTIENTIKSAQSTPESDLPAAIASIQKQLATPGLPLRAKRAAQAAVTALQTKLKAFEKAQQKQGGAAFDISTLTSDLLSKAPRLAGGSLVITEIPGATPDQLMAIFDSLRKKSPSHALMLAGVADGKVSLLAAVSDDLIAKGLKAGDWIREPAKIAGGSGGGRPSLAQAGGKDPSKLPEALAKARDFANTTVK